jgi:hypothetical protein
MMWSVVMLSPTLRIAFVVMLFRERTGYRERLDIRAAQNLDRLGEVIRRRLDDHVVVDEEALRHFDLLPCAERAGIGEHAGERRSRRRLRADQIDLASAVPTCPQNCG